MWYENTPFVREEYTEYLNTNQAWLQEVVSFTPLLR